MAERIKVPVRLSGNGPQNKSKFILIQPKTTPEQTLYRSNTVSVPILHDESQPGTWCKIPRDKTGSRRKNPGPIFLFKVGKGKSNIWEESTPRWKGGERE